jgi:branched-chain amino acid transport system ATP-binding protein
MTAPRLALDGVSVTHGPLAAVRDATLVVGAGEIVVLLGANGAGKSSLLKAAMGLVPLASGRVALDGAEISALPAEARARRGIAYVPEGRRLFPGLTARANLLVACRADAAERDRRLAAALAPFPELAPHLDRRAWQLSGGQQQMVALARGFMAAPGVMLVDEPTLGLAPLLADRVLAALRACAEAGAALLVAEQSAGAARRLTEGGRGRILGLERGRLAPAPVPA